VELTQWGVAQNHPKSDIRNPKSLFSRWISLSCGRDSQKNTQSDQYQFAHANPSTGDVHEMRAEPQSDTHDDESYQVNPKRHCTILLAED
jgi:hypothetical protein